MRLAVPIQFHLELPKGFKMESVSEQRLVSALAVVAGLIEDFGDAYWPVFDTLEQELTLVRARKAKLYQYRSSVTQTLESSSFKPNLENKDA